MSLQDERMERAKELFLKYHGNHFYMDHDGVGYEYDRYHVPEETEKLWAEALVSDFLKSRTRGREALGVYAAVTDLLNCDRRDEDWEECLYYPLRSEHLDDAAILFMLPHSFRLAERAVKKRCFSREEADAYLCELDRYLRDVQVRAENGTLTRAEDFVMQEFSDPIYVAGYLRDLRKKWNGLFR